MNAAVQTALADLMSAPRTEDQFALLAVEDVLPEDMTAVNVDSVERTTQMHHEAAHNGPGDSLYAEFCMRQPCIAPETVVVPR